MIIIHRVNTIERLQTTDTKYGVEVDIRTYKNRLIINHEPFEDGDELEQYIKQFRHQFIILDIKEEGIETRVMEIMEKYNISNYFLLGVTPPFIYQFINKKVKKMAIRFSEFESIETCENFAGKVEWVWVDTFTKLPLNKDAYRTLSKHFKICLVCPERWGRPNDIRLYIKQMKKDNIKIDAVMTAGEYANQWENSGALNFFLENLFRPFSD